jgi:hypothetical protein
MVMTGKARNGEANVTAEGDPEAAPKTRREIVWKGHLYPFDEREFTAMDFRRLIGPPPEGEEPREVPMFLRWNKGNNWVQPLDALGFLTEEEQVRFLTNEQDLEVVEVED